MDVSYKVPFEQRWSLPLTPDPAAISSYLLWQSRSMHFLDKTEEVEKEGEREGQKITHHICNPVSGESSIDCMQATLGILTSIGLIGSYCQVGVCIQIHLI